MGKRILFLLTGPLVVVTLAGWFLFGPSLLKPTGLLVDAPPGSTINAGCQTVYQRIMTGGFAGPRIMAQDGFKVEKALYISGREAKANYNASGNFSDDAHLCYILVRGNIVVGGPFTNKSVIYPTGFAIYDPASFTQMQIGAGEHY